MVEIDKDFISRSLRFGYQNLTEYHILLRSIIHFCDEKNVPLSEAVRDKVYLYLGM